MPPPIRHVNEQDRARQPAELDHGRDRDPSERRRLDRRPHPAQPRHQRDDPDADTDQNSDQDAGVDQLVLDVAVARRFRSLALSSRNDPKRYLTGFGESLIRTG
jgi:hypothetical protein